MKQEHASLLSGHNFKANQNMRQISRKRKVVEVKKQWIEQLQDLKEDKAHFLCPCTCPQTGRYCTEEFLTNQGKMNHVNKGKH